MDIIRNNGYIDLNLYFMQKYGKSRAYLADILELTETEQLGARDKFWFNFEDKKVMYKSAFMDSYEEYAEVIMTELAKCLRIESAQYDLALMKFDDNKMTKGIITYNFKKEGCKYLVGSEIILSVYRRYIADNPDLIKELGLEGLEREDYIVNKLNNLENIWFILDLYFKDEVNKSEIIADIMNQLVSVLMFDVLTNQGDRHSDNWMLEFDGPRVRLAPLYDNSNACNLNRSKTLNNMITNLKIYEKANRIKKPRLYDRIVGQLYHPKMLLTVLPRESMKDGNVRSLEVLENFINMSVPEYRERLIEMIEFFKSNKLEEVFLNVESKTECEIPEDLKYYLRNVFQIHIAEIEKRFDLQEWQVRGINL